MPRWTKVFSTFLLFYWSIAAAWLLALWIEPTLPGWMMCFWIGIAKAVLALPFAWLGAQADQRDQAFAVSMRATNTQLLLKTFDARWRPEKKRSHEPRRIRSGQHQPG